MNPPLQEDASSPSFSDGATSPSSPSSPVCETSASVGVWSFFVAACLEYSTLVLAFVAFSLLLSLYYFPFHTLFTVALVCYELGIKFIPELASCPSLRSPYVIAPVAAAYFCYAFPVASFMLATLTWSIYVLIPIIAGVLLCLVIIALLAPAVVFVPAVVVVGVPLMLMSVVCNMVSDEEQPPKREDPVGLCVFRLVISRLIRTVKQSTVSPSVVSRRCNMIMRLLSGQPAPRAAYVEKRRYLKFFNADVVQVIAARMDPEEDVPVPTLVETPSIQSESVRVGRACCSVGRFVCSFIVVLITFSLPNVVQFVQAVPVNAPAPAAPARPAAPPGVSTVVGPPALLPGNGLMERIVIGHGHKYIGWTAAVCSAGWTVVASYAPVSEAASPIIELFRQAPVERHWVKYATRVATQRMKATAANKIVEHVGHGFYEWAIAPRSNEHIVSSLSFTWTDPLPIEPNYSEWSPITKHVNEVYEQHGTKVECAPPIVNISDYERQHPNVYCLTYSYDYFSASSRCYRTDCWQRETCNKDDTDDACRSKKAGAFTLNSTLNPLPESESFQQLFLQAFGPVQTFFTPRHAVNDMSYGFPSQWSSYAPETELNNTNSSESSASQPAGANESSGSLPETGNASVAAPMSEQRVSAEVVAETDPPVPPPPQMSFSPTSGTTPSTQLSPSSPPAAAPSSPPPPPPPPGSNDTRTNFTGNNTNTSNSPLRNRLHTVRVGFETFTMEKGPLTLVCRITDAYRAGIAFFSHFATVTLPYWFVVLRYGLGVMWSGLSGFCDKWANPVFYGSMKWCFGKFVGFLTFFFEMCKAIIEWGGSAWDGMLAHVCREGFKWLKYVAPFIPLLYFLWDVLKWIWNEIWASNDYFRKSSVQRNQLPGNGAGVGVNDMPRLLQEIYYFMNTLQLLFTSWRDFHVCFVYVVMRVIYCVFYVMWYVGNMRFVGWGWKIFMGVGGWLAGRSVELYRDNREQTHGVYFMNDIVDALVADVATWKTNNVNVVGVMKQDVQNIKRRLGEAQGFNKYWEVKRFRWRFAAVKSRHMHPVFCTGYNAQVQIEISRRSIAKLNVENVVEVRLVTSCGNSSKYFTLPVEDLALFRFSPFDDTLYALASENVVSAVANSSLVPFSGNAAAIQTRESFKAERYGVSGYSAGDRLVGNSNIGFSAVRPNNALFVQQAPQAQQQPATVLQAQQQTAAVPPPSATPATAPTVTTAPSAQQNPQQSNLGGNGPAESSAGDGPECWSDDDDADAQADKPGHGTGYGTCWVTSVVPIISAAIERAIKVNGRRKVFEKVTQFQDAHNHDEREKILCEWIGMKHDPHHQDDARDILQKVAKVVKVNPCTSSAHHDHSLVSYVKVISDGGKVLDGFEKRFALVHYPTGSDSWHWTCWELHDGKWYDLDPTVSVVTASSFEELPDGSSMHPVYIGTKYDPCEVGFIPQECEKDTFDIPSVGEWAASVFYWPARWAAAEWTKSVEERDPDFNKYISLQFFKQRSEFLGKSKRLVQVLRRVNQQDPLEQLCARVTGALEARVSHNIVLNHYCEVLKARAPEEDDDIACAVVNNDEGKDFVAMYNRVKKQWGVIKWSRSENNDPARGLLERFILVPLACSHDEFINKYKNVCFVVRKRQTGHGAKNPVAGENPSCSSCGNKQAKHIPRFVARKCSSCDASFFGSCAMVPATWTRWNEADFLASGASFTCVMCNAARSEVTNKSTKRPPSPPSSTDLPVDRNGQSVPAPAVTSEVAVKTPDESSEVVKATVQRLASTLPPPTKKPAKSVPSPVQEAKAAPPPAPASKTPETPPRAVKQAPSARVSSEKQPVASGDVAAKKATKKQKVQHPSEKCAGEGCPNKGLSAEHPWARTHRKCCKCSAFFFGHCHGEDKTDISRNDSSDYVCAKCRPSTSTATVTPAPAPAPQSASPAVTPVRSPDSSLHPDAKSSTKRKRNRRTSKSKSVRNDNDNSNNNNEDYVREMQHQQEAGEAAAPPPCSNEKCALCDVAAAKHAFGGSRRQCNKCKKVYLGKHHGEDHTVHGHDRNNTDEFTCVNCAREAGPRFAANNEHETTENRDEKCKACGSNSQNHSFPESYRRCDNCGGFTWGPCHGGSHNQKFNKLYFRCSQCAKQGDAVSNREQRNLMKTKEMVSNIALPTGYKREDHTTWSLGTVSEEDNQRAIPADTPSLIKSGNGNRLESAPSAAVVTGRMFSSISIHQTPSPDLRNAFHPQTVQMHLRFLDEFQQHLKRSPAWLDLPLTAAAIRFLAIRAKAPNKEGKSSWQPQTLLRNASSFFGALSNLPLYSDANLGVVLSYDPTWKCTLRYWRAEAQNAQPSNQAATSYYQVVEAIDATPLDDLPTMFMLALQWVLGARVSDILMLRRHHVVWNNHTRELQVKIDEGKMKKTIDPYTVHAIVSEEMAPIFESFLSKIKDSEERLFPFTTISRIDRIKKINIALKRVDLGLSTRAVRRGALQSMAVKGVNLSTLRLFSGHKSDEMCKRYLDWGALAGEDKQRMFQASIKRDNVWVKAIDSNRQPNLDAVLHQNTTTLYPTAPSPQN